MVRRRPASNAAIEDGYRIMPSRLEGPVDPQGGAEVSGCKPSGDDDDVAFRCNSKLTEEVGKVMRLREKAASTLSLDPPPVCCIVAADCCGNAPGLVCGLTATFG
jgi:hypothetical protein